MQTETTKLTFTTEARREHVSAGETASWHYILDVPAATVEAKCIDIGGRPTSLAEAYWVVVKVPATIVDGYLPGGIDRQIGKPYPFSFQTYGYMVRRAMAEGSPHWAVTEGGAE